MQYKMLCRKSHRLGQKAKLELQFTCWNHNKRRSRTNDRKSKVFCSRN